MSAWYVGYIPLDIQLHILVYIVYGYTVMYLFISFNGLSSGFVHHAVTIFDFKYFILFILSILCI